MGTLLKMLSSIEFFSALIGAVTGGVFVLLGTLLAWWLEAREQKRIGKELLKSTLLAISTELKVLLEQYNQTAGDVLEKLEPGNFAYLFYYTENEYFTIFHNNAAMLGHIEDKRLVNDIVSVYIKIKSLLDTFNTHNDMLKSYNELVQINSVNPTATTKALLDSQLTNLVTGSTHLKRKHEEVKKLSAKLINEIDTGIESGNLLI